MNNQLLFKERIYGTTYIRVNSNKRNAFRLLVMRTFLLLLFLIVLQSSAKVTAQTVTLNFKNAPIESILQEIKKQTKYDFAYNEQLLKNATPITISVKNAVLAEALKKVFEGQPFTYKFTDRIIVIKEKEPSNKNSSLTIDPSYQSLIKGRVVDSLGNPLGNVTVQVIGSNTATKTNSDGTYELKVEDKNSTISFHHLGWEPANRKASDTYTTITMYRQNIYLDNAVVEVNTGYQTLAKERATGSFSTISNELFNQQVSTDIISRLPAVANSMVADRSSSFGGNGQIMIRGLSTISGPKDPLIVLDNFPYDGDINNINPNIIENITILKDASASSIWGARAANGVIVITTKKGQFNRPIKVDLNSNITISKSPDLSIIRQMKSTDFIDVEQELFKRGFYNTQLGSRSKPVVSPVVDLLDKQSRGVISDDELNKALSHLRTVDIRDQLEKHIYQRSVNQQYFISASGGSEKFAWTSASGYDKNKNYLATGYDRINLRFQNTYQPIAKLSLTTNLYYTQTKNNSGRYGYHDIQSYPYPYMEIADENGNPLPVAKNYNQSFKNSFGDGLLLDWNYYPLTDWQHQIRTDNSSDLLGSAIIKYDILKGLQATVDYQYERTTGLGSALYDDQSYMARDYINRFSQIVNGKVTYIVPKGGIMDKSTSTMDAHNVRFQLNFNRSFGKHSINAIAGTEARAAKTQTSNDRFYGYNANNMTVGNIDYTRAYPNIVTGSNTTIINLQSLGETNRRFTSQFTNAAYTYDNKYIISGSVRRDASNLFGVKTNDQWNPFWSAGAAWKISNEKFYKFDFLPYLNLRATYGFSGNINPAMVAVNTIRFISGVSIYNGNTVARFNNYYNPRLRWETSKMFNLAADFRLKNNRLTGSLEYYSKKGDNLFGQSLIDYTTGVDPYMLTNVASMKGKGLDVELHSLNIDRSFKWKTTLNLSTYRDKTVDYLINRTMAAEYTNSINPPISGVSGHAVYSIYGYKWAGLDPQTGDPMGYLDGEVSTDYASIIGTGTAVNELEYFGSAIPTKFGSLINGFSYKNFSLQVGLTYKLGYWFRRPSINYTDLFNMGKSDPDYALRWQKPGDELNTYVPSNTYKTDSNRDQFYSGASVLIEKGDHIRLQYITFSYDFLKKRFFDKMQCYVNINNLGMIWKANKADIDPDLNYTGGRFLNPTTCALGLRAQF